MVQRIAAPTHSDGLSHVQRLASIASWIACPNNTPKDLVKISQCSPVASCWTDVRLTIKGHLVECRVIFFFSLNKDKLLKPHPKTLPSQDPHSTQQPHSCNLLAQKTQVELQTLPPTSPLYEGQKCWQVMGNHIVLPHILFAEVQHAGKPQAMGTI